MSNVMSPVGGAGTVQAVAVQVHGPGPMPQRASLPQSMGMNVGSPQGSYAQVEPPPCVAELGRQL